MLICYFVKIMFSFKQEIIKTTINKKMKTVFLQRLCLLTL